jgi:hypothetical protein
MSRVVIIVLIYHRHKPIDTETLYVSCEVRPNLYRVKL